MSKPLWMGGVLLRKDGSETTGYVRQVATDDHGELLPHLASYEGKFLGILPSKQQAQEAVEEAAGLVSRRSFLLLGLGSILKPRHKPVVIWDAAMDVDTGKLTVAVPVEYQDDCKVWLNGKLLRKDVDFRVTMGGIFPLPGPYLVEWMVHRSRHKVSF